MSHVAQVELHVLDLEALKDAASALGLELVKQSTYRWYGYSAGDYPLPKGFTAADLGQCEYALRIPGNMHAYEIGIVPRRDGQAGYALLWDFWQGGYGLLDKVGNDAEKLVQGYALEVVRKEYARDGFYLTETVNEITGEIEITATR